MKRYILAPAGFALTLTLVAASAAPPDQRGVAQRLALSANGNDAPKSKATKAAQGEQNVTDSDITQAIVRRLNRHPTIPFDGIDVETDQGIVTMTGKVTSLLAFDLASDIAQRTKGVRAVVNRLKVTTGQRTDDQILTDVKAALISDPTTDAYEITTTVTDGIVTMTGKVESWTERQLAERVVRGVKGVTGVQNQLTLATPKNRVDSEIADDVRARLRWDRRIDDKKIDVQVKDGKVTLTGTVGSLAERLWATADAWVIGVKDVDSKGLKVDEWWDRKNLRRDLDTVAKSDAEIAKAVKDALLFDPRVYSFNPTVTVNNGVVTLTGVVENLAAKRAAEINAQNTVGVWRVRNLLKVRPEKEPAETDLANSVRMALLRDPEVNRLPIRVVADNGYITLYGTVGSYYERARAEDIAEQVNGVIDVRNYILVDLPDMAAVPEISARDIEIREDIEDEMFWSPWVQADQVTTAVSDGVATLTGIVDTWSESQAATENAFEGGARKVINKLQVRQGPSYRRP